MSGPAKALEGIKVLELGRVPPAEFPGMMLADMGADVLKIETPSAAPRTDDEKRDSVFTYTNRNKRSMVLDMKSPEGGAIFMKLAAEADVVIEGFRPGVMKRLNADYERVSAINPRVVYCSLSGFGQDGPYRDRPAHDLDFLALSGVLGLIGKPGEKPAIPLNLVSDYGGASMHGALGIMFALFARERSGRGQHIDISYLDTTVALLAATPNLRYFFSKGKVATRGQGVTGGTYPYYSVYETRDGKLLTVACSETRLWENFCRAIGRPEFVAYKRDPDHFLRSASPEESEVRMQIESIMRTRDRDDWYESLIAADVCCGKVQDVEEVVADPQIRHRQMVVDVDSPIAGRVRQFGPAIRMSATPASVRHAAPTPGEHTDAVLASLGMTASQIDDLRKSGTIQ